MATTIRNPIEWGYDQLRHAASGIAVTGRAVRGDREHVAAPAVRKIGAADLRDALARGLDDFGASRTDVIFLCLIYPIAGLVLGRFVVGSGMFPLLFPLVSGFALIGPFIAVGVYELSKQREEGHETDWASAFAVVRAPSFAGIVALGLVLAAIFLVWLITAQAIYDVTLGQQQPASLGAFISDVLMTPRGWALAAIGIGVGFVFAAVVFAISVVSFPLLLDRDVGLGTAVGTSLRVIAANPVPMAIWGAIIAAGLVVGSLPLLLGLILVVPVIGHASWHLYRKTVMA